MPDFPPCDDTCGALEEHVRRSFPGQSVEALTWTSGPIVESNPHFRALRVAPPQPSGLWTYVSIGGWSSSPDARHGLEFVLSLPAENPRGVELLAMTVFYNRVGRVGLGDTVPIGEPWLPGSACDHLLLSLPYPFGPDLQTCHVGDRHVEFLWLLPITESERAFKITRGVEALETLFEDKQLRYWQVNRAGVV